jgi:hypothetical protein
MYNDRKRIRKTENISFTRGQNLSQGGAESLPGGGRISPRGGQNLSQGGAESLPLIEKKNLLNETHKTDLNHNKNLINNNNYNIDLNNYYYNKFIEKEGTVHIRFDDMERNNFSLLPGKCDNKIRAPDSNDYIPGKKIVKAIIDYWFSTNQDDYKVGSFIRKFGDMFTKIYVSKKSKESGEHWKTVKGVT